MYVNEHKIDEGFLCFLGIIAASRYLTHIHVNPFVLGHTGDVCTRVYTMPVLDIMSV